MAVTRYTIDGYGVLELNQVAFPTTGTIEAQCKLDKENDFKTLSTDATKTTCEIGMLLAVDKVNGIVKLPGASETLPIAINYSAEHIYDERIGLKNFKLTVNDFYPRMGYLAVGDLFTTNCVSYATTEWANDEAFIAAMKAVKTTAAYGGISTDGSILVSATAPASGTKLQVVKATTMPDGQFAVQFRVLVA